MDGPQDQWRAVKTSKNFKEMHFAKRLLKHDSKNVHNTGHHPLTKPIRTDQAISIYAILIDNWERCAAILTVKDWLSTFNGQQIKDRHWKPSSRSSNRLSSEKQGNRQDGFQKYVTRCQNGSYTTIIIWPCPPYEVQKCGLSQWCTSKSFTLISIQQGQNKNNGTRKRSMNKLIPNNFLTFITFNSSICTQREIGQIMLNQRWQTKMPFARSFTVIDSKARFPKRN